MLDPLKIALTQQLEELETLRATVTTSAESATTANNATFLQGRSVGSFTTAGTQALTSHQNTQGPAHGETAASLGMYTETEIRAKADGLFDQILMPATRIGSNNYLPPNISSGQQAVNNAAMTGCPMIFEPDGSLVAAVPMTNGEIVNNYLFYWPNGTNTIDNDLEIPDPVITNEILTLPEGYRLINCSSGTDEVFVATGELLADGSIEVFIVLTNGSFKKGNFTYYKMRVSEGNLFNIPGVMPINNLKGITVRLATVNGVKKILLLAEEVNRADAQRPAINIYTANVPTAQVDTINLTLTKDWTVTRSNGSVETQTNIIPNTFIYRSSADPAADRALATLVYDASSLGVPAYNSETSYHIFQNPANSAEFILLMTNWMQFYTLTTFSAGNYYFAAVYRFNILSETMSDAYAGQPITATAGSGSAVVFNNARAQSGGAYNSLFFLNRGGTTIERGDKLVVVRPEHFDYRYTLLNVNIPIGQGSTWYEYFNANVNAAHPTIPRSRGLEPAGRGPISNNLRYLFPISDTFSGVMAAGYVDGAYSSGGHNGTFATARHNDGIRPLMVNSLYNGKQLAVPEALSPRFRAPYNENLQYEHAAFSVFRKDNGSASTRGGMFTDDTPLSIRKTMAVNPTTGEVIDDGARIVMDAQAWANLGTSTPIQQILANHANVISYKKELFTPVAFVAANWCVVLVTVATAERESFTYSFSGTLVYQNVGQHINISSVTLASTPFDNRTSYVNLTTGSDPVRFEPATAVSAGFTVLHGYTDGESVVWYIGFNSKYVSRQVNSSGNVRMLYRYREETNTMSLAATMSGHVWSGSSTFYSDKQYGICRMVGDRNGASDYGSKLIGIPMFLSSADAIASNGGITMVDYNTLSFAIFTVKPPATYDLVLPDPIPVTLNGATVNIPAMTTSIFTGVNSPDPAGRIHIYVKVDKEGEPYLAFTKSLFADGLTTIYLGYVDYDEEGIINIRLFKVTKLGNFRLTEGGSPDPVLNVLEVARTEGLPYL